MKPIFVFVFLQNPASSLPKLKRITGQVDYWRKEPDGLLQMRARGAALRGHFIITRGSRCHGRGSHHYSLKKKPRFRQSVSAGMGSVPGAFIARFSHPPLHVWFMFNLSAGSRNITSRTCLSIVHIYYIIISESPTPEVFRYFVLLACHILACSQSVVFWARSDGLG